MTVQRTTIEIEEQGDRKLAVLSSGVSLQGLVSGLNALGVGPRDMITILQASRRRTRCRQKSRSCDG